MQPMMGMPAGIDWILNGKLGQVDKTYLKDWFSLTFYRENTGYWAPRVQHCDVFIKKTESESIKMQYKGVMSWLEKIKVEPNRIPLSEPSEEEPDAGYLFRKGGDGRNITPDQW